jgi:hypothetical protein
MRKLTVEEFIQKSIAIHGNKYDYSNAIYKSNKQKVFIVCKIHGKFEQVPQSHLNGIGCSSCSGHKKLTSADFIHKANKIHTNKFDYSKTNYREQKTKVTIICPTHGEFTQLPYHHLQGFGCSKCSGLKTLNTIEFISKANQIHHNKYNYAHSNYKSNRQKVKITCPLHGEFHQRAKDHLNGEGCPRCHHIISKSELEFLSYLDISQEHHQKFIKPYKVDALKNNIIYEFLGDYYHGNPDVYSPSTYNETCHKTHRELYERTINRFNFLKKLGYNIKYIWENDWKKFKRGTDKNPKILEYL